MLRATWLCLCFVLLQFTSSDATKRALVSILTDLSQNDYVKGAWALSKSHERHAKDYFHSKVMLVLEGRNYTEDILRQVREAGWHLRWVKPILPLKPTEWPPYRDLFTKFHIWNLTDFDRAVYMDLDVVFVSKVTGTYFPPDPPRDCRLWAARDWYSGKFMPGINAGVLGVKPNQEEFDRLVGLAMNGGVEYEQAWSEQGFLSVLFKKEWCEIPMEKNANLAFYPEVPRLWKALAIEAIHFTENKPWNCGDKFKKVCKRWDAEYNADVKLQATN